MRARLLRLAPLALVVGCFFVTGLVSVALAGPGSGGTGPGGGCPVATATSPGCVSLNQIQNPANLSTNVVDAGYLLLSGTQPQTVCTNATAICAVKSSINAATAGAGTPAFSFEPANALDADDALLMLYAVSGGASVFQVDLEGDTVAGGAVQYGNANGNLTSASAATMALRSSATDATTSGTVGAITLKALSNITATDLLLDVQDSAANHALTLTEQGDLVVPQGGSIGTGGTGSGCGLYQGTGKALSLSGSASSCLAGVYFSTGSGSGPLKLAINAANEFQFTSTELAPDSASGSSLGTTALPWSDIAGDASMRGSCTLNGGVGTSTCTATVTAAAICTCSPVGTTAAVAAGGCAVSLSGTTLTLSGPSLAINDVNYHCIL